MNDNNSDEGLSELDDSPDLGFDVDKRFDNFSIEDVRINMENQDYQRSLEKECKEEYMFNTEQPSMEIDPIEEQDRLEMPEPTKFDVTKSTAADVAYLAWKSDGPVTAAEIQMESWKPESRPGFLTKDDAEQGLRALAHAGLVSLSTSEFTKDTGDLYTDNVEEGFTASRELDPDSSMVGPLKYRTGGEEELGAPVISEDDVISDPARAFQEVGQMQQNYSFTLDQYTEVFGDYSPKF